jgi:hypothetical protein
VMRANNSLARVSTPCGVAFYLTGIGGDCLDIIGRLNPV